MGLALIVYGVFATTVLVFCTISRVGPQPLYIGISMDRLKGLLRKREDVVVVDLRGTGHGTISDALRVPVEELNGFLRWVPPRSTLVLCGWNDAARCRDDIARSLLRLGIDFVYVADEVGNTVSKSGPQEFTAAG
jgi:hypothetical protein